MIYKLGYFQFFDFLYGARIRDFLKSCLTYYRKVLI